MVIQLKAAQHLYANVEKEQSPHGRGGFQTLFYSRDRLSEAEVAELEGRLLYFPGDNAPVKRLAFPLTNGRHVVAQIVPLPDPDRYGRKGRYLAHSLVFERADFARLAANPFPVFALAPFITTVAEALAAGDFARADLPPLQIALTVPSEDVSGGHWPPSELQKLALLALRAEKMTADRRAVAFVGSPEAVEAALQAPFFAVPLSLRSHLSFDTYFYRCNLVASYFWAVGLPERPANPTLDGVDAAAGWVLSLADDRPQTAYEHWVWHNLGRLESRSLDAFVASREAAFAFCSWLEAGAPAGSAPGELSDELVETVLGVNRSLVQSLLQQKLAQVMPSVLAARLFEAVYDPERMFDHYRQFQSGFRRETLLTLLYQVYEQTGFRPPPPEECKALATVLAETPFPLLAVILAIWTGRPKQRRLELVQLTENEYHQVLQIVTRYRLADPLTLFVSGRGDVFLDFYLDSPLMNRDQLRPLVETAFEAGEPACLGRLTPYLPGQVPAELRRIEKLVKKEASTPPVFRAALTEALAQAPERGLRRLVKRLTAPFHRGSGDEVDERDDHL